MIQGLSRSFYDKAVASKMLSVSMYELVSVAVYTQTCCEQGRFMFPPLGKHASTQIGVFDCLTGASPTLYTICKILLSRQLTSQLGSFLLFTAVHSIRLIASVEENFLFSPSSDCNAVAVAAGRGHAFQVTVRQEATAPRHVQA